MLRKLLNIISIIVLIYGCSKTGDIYRGTGVDEIPISPCAKCNKKPFYINGKYVSEDCK